MKHWTGEIPGRCSQAEVQVYCVQDKEWQRFRLSLKGACTEVKLDELLMWYQSRVDRYPRRTRVQVDNYLNALKRGGLLSMELEVVR